MQSENINTENSSNSDGILPTPSTPFTPISPSLENSFSLFASSLEHSIASLVNTINRNNNSIDLDSLPKIDPRRPNVCGWYSKFVSWLEYHNITDKELIFKLCKMATPDDHAEDLDELLLYDDNNRIIFPQLFTIKKKLLSVVEGEKDPYRILEKIKTLSISSKQSIVDFNREYKKLYRKLDKKFKPAITVFDYVNSIKSRSEACKGIHVNKCTDLNEAYELAERYEEAHLKYSYHKPTTSTSHYFHQNKIQLNRSNTPNDNMNRKVIKESHVKEMEDLTQGVKEMRIKTCYFCNEEGHVKYACPAYNKMKYNEFKRNELEEEETPLNSE
ncbi:hypothetical protein BCR32DRAFT_273030 [Anaeromyces robustus]|uniref:CCHC-type domain-containing protein n=1 Tax=Anaeromyces robustus TaxID=1754192 RepID=A0A1Y1VV43_9FUNG|nr:hypothetical protein BCR32DRAFT_273030 [Anaeromyces robustus]|eukprot:ORX64634.1 hypothetical protein BCR32DRAFT_273030 [Anaeromyces robustus]